MLYMATIYGYTEIRSFSSDKEKAKKTALKLKKKLFPDEPIDKWTWERVSEYYGATVEEIKDGVVFVDNQPWD